MFAWIGNKAFAGHDAPDNVKAALEALGDLAEVAGLRAPKGGISRQHVVERLGEIVTRAGLTVAPDSYFDGLNREQRLALRVEAGRAHTNNDALLATLEAARDPHVDVLLLVVPVRYMSGAVVDPVKARLKTVLNSPGIDLALTGVALTAY